jgi:malonate-semialdehyde dehydrogenase (acetylating) / methylmalonate-semialdehyde dehydrogenase
MTNQAVMRNFIAGQWINSVSPTLLDVNNPATQELLTRVPLSTAADTLKAVDAAVKAQPAWQAIPAWERVQYLFKMKHALEEHSEEITRLITLECGKTLGEARGELQRAVENLEVAVGIPTLLQGKFSEDIAPGIDELLIRQPVGVAAAICPFNFPAMIPFWYMPYALACGNTYIVKPSERVPLTMQRIFEVFEPIGLPAGVLNLVNGGKEAVDALLDDSRVRAISFVGSTPTARYIYSRTAANGKRAQCQGGAKNPVVILPDADPEMTTRIVTDSAFGCAGQRCLAASLAITVGSARTTFVDLLKEAALQRTTGNGLDPDIQMGPVISPQACTRIEGLIASGVAEGASLLVDGRSARITGFEQGNFIRPTILLDVPPQGETFRTEIFGPVLGILSVDTLEQAIALANQGAYGNAASVFTSSGTAARKFRSEVQAGNIGVNIGIAAPMASFPFSGWKDSFFGELHGQAMDAVEFFTQSKVVVERWPKEWSRKF